MLHRIRPRPFTPSPGHRFERPPYPTGWYAVARSEEVPRGALKTVRALGRELVAFRGEDGVARVLDAYCPHLGAHLGHGGCVVGNAVRCPFHGWSFGGDGRCVDIPYARRIPPNASIESLPACEASGHLFVWGDAAGGPPAWELPFVEECVSPGWIRQPGRSFSIRAHVQDMAENGVDSAHFGCVHGLGGVTDMAARVDRHVLRVRSEVRYPESLGGAEGTIVTANWGLGFNTTHFTGVVQTMLVVCATPVEPELAVVRITPYVRDTGDPMMVATVGSFFLREVETQFAADIPIWEHKVMRLRPVLCEGDGPIGTFRRWTRQFYPEGAADAGEAGEAEGA